MYIKIGLYYLLTITNYVTWIEKIREHFITIFMETLLIFLFILFPSTWYLSAQDLYMVPKISIPTTLRIIELFEQKRSLNGQSFWRKVGGKEDDSEQKPSLGNMDICETTLCKKSFFCPFVWVVHFLINQWWSQSA